MDLQMINPYVRFARDPEPHRVRGILFASDHRIFYCRSGNSIFEVDGQQYSFAAGSLIYIPAGSSYQLEFDHEPPVYLGCNFDFYQEHAHISTPIPPLHSDRFLPESILEKQIFEKGGIYSHCVLLQNAFFMEERFIEIVQEYLNHNLYYDARCSTLLKDILIQTARLTSRENQGINSQKVEAILQYIHTHYHDKLTNKELAEKFNYHENYISNLILRCTGLPLHQYILHYKMHMAIGLLQASPLTIGEVAEKVGMPDIKHFSKCFQKVIGSSPSNFKTI